MNRVNITDEQFDSMANIFGYRGLPNRWKVMEYALDIKEGDIVIDGGGFHGDSIIYFSKKVGVSGKVYSFEPHPYNYKILNDTVKRYVKNNNVVSFPIALWNKNERIPLYLSNYINACSPIKDFRKVGNEYIYVVAHKFDTISQKYNINIVNHIWMNIESSEVNALKGMKNTLLNNNIRLLISTHKVTDDYSTTDDVIDLLQSYGYKANRLENHEMWILGYKE